MFELKPSDWLLIMATLCGPVLAVQAQKLVERIRENQQRKLKLFYTLMATRGAGVAPERVEALNMMELVFGTPRWWGLRKSSSLDRTVIAAWRTHFDALSVTEPASQSQKEAMDAKIADTFYDLLLTISVAVGYTFDKVHLKRTAYTPTGHINLENTRWEIMSGIRDLLVGKSPLKMSVVEFPNSEDALKQGIAVQKALLDLLSGAKPLAVEVQPSPKNSNE